MDYNTSRKKLILPEYGRSIQKMVDHLKTIEDRDKRNQQARAVIQVMGNLFPHLRDINDFKHKLWDHLFVMSDFDLDIDSPYPILARESFRELPNIVPYANPKSIKIKHYGRGVQDILHIVAEMPEGEEREAAVTAMANHMKKAYLTWNKDVVTDEQIFADIALLSAGKITIDPETQLSVGNYGNGESQRNTMGHSNIGHPKKNNFGRNKKRPNNNNNGSNNSSNKPMHKNNKPAI